MARLEDGRRRGLLRRKRYPLSADENGRGVTRSTILGHKRLSKTDVEDLIRAAHGRDEDSWFQFYLGLELRWISV